MAQSRRKESAGKTLRPAIRTMEQSADGVGEILDAAASTMKRTLAATAEMAGQVVARGAEMMRVPSRRAGAGTTVKAAKRAKPATRKARRSR